MNLIAHLPSHHQIFIKQLIFAWKIKTNRLVTDEPEYHYIESIVHDGDSVIDIGANIGVYTLKFSRLVGPTGRIYALEPIPESFYLLAANVHVCGLKNVTLNNIAASDRTTLVTMSIPYSGSGFRNYYRASIADPNRHIGVDTAQVLACPLDSLNLPSRINLVKIDAEGHESAVLAGMKGIVTRDKPILIIETVYPEAAHWLESEGYRSIRLPGSPNTIFSYMNS